jgi:hypothetical protein
MAVTVEQVRCATGIYTDPPSDACVQQAIDLADRLVQAQLASAPCHTTQSLEDVTLYLASHFLALAYQRKSSEKIEETQEAFRAPGVLLQQLDYTTYGQTAKLLDCSRRLQNLGRRQVGLMVAGGGGDFQTFDDETAPENQ